MRYTVISIITNIKDDDHDMQIFIRGIIELIVLLNLQRYNFLRKRKKKNIEKIKKLRGKKNRPKPHRHLGFLGFVFNFRYYYYYFSETLPHCFCWVDVWFLISGASTWHATRCVSAGL